MPALRGVPRSLSCSGTLWCWKVHVSLWVLPAVEEDCHGFHGNRFISLLAISLQVAGWFERTNPVSDISLLEVAFLSLYLHIFAWLTRPLTDQRWAESTRQRKADRGKLSSKGAGCTLSSSHCTHTARQDVLWVAVHGHMCLTLCWFTGTKICTDLSVHIDSLEWPMCSWRSAGGVYKLTGETAME